MGGAFFLTSASPSLEGRPLTSLAPKPARVPKRIARCEADKGPKVPGKRTMEVCRLSTLGEKPRGPDFRTRGEETDGPGSDQTPGRGWEGATLRNARPLKGGKPRAGKGRLRERAAAAPSPQRGLRQKGSPEEPRSHRPEERKGGCGQGIVVGTAREGSSASGSGWAPGRRNQGRLAPGCRAGLPAAPEEEQPLPGAAVNRRLPRRSEAFMASLPEGFCALPGLARACGRARSEKGKKEVELVLGAREQEEPHVESSSVFKVEQQQLARSVSAEGQAELVREERAICQESEWVCSAPFDLHSS
ncbi:uncharacterized protein LOC129339062 [Eublepharis macularius]|uniref:Uncharacterized protein LOC129339062 n=1 Tax=Eublepharis macularius TaxID=481883 RepID=A0AA97K6U1_EUBMA|nr:uncharacterized protein LOC129339062 [Eublepharis macularius]